MVQECTGLAASFFVPGQVHHEPFRQLADEKVNGKLLWDLEVLARDLFSRNLKPLTSSYGSGVFNVL